MPTEKRCILQTKLFYLKEHNGAGDANTLRGHFESCVKYEFDLEFDHFCDALLGFPIVVT